MISVIIPVYNDEANLSECLKSICNCDYNKQYEVIVYDDFSIDSSARIAESFGFKVIRSEINNGPGIGRNIAVKHAKGDILAFTDSDCVVPKNWLTIIEGIFSDPNIQAAAGKYSVSLNPQFVSKYRMYESSFHIYREKAFVNTSSSNNLLCRKEAFLKSGGFGERRIAEDLVFGYNLYKIGVNILLVPDLTVSHFCKTTLKEYIKQQYAWLKNILDVHMKYPETLNFKWPANRGPLIYQLMIQIMMLPICLLIFVWPLSFALLLIVAFIALFIMNYKYLVYVYKGENNSVKSLLITYSITLLRNYAWILGALAGIGCLRNAIILLKYLFVTRILRHKSS